MARRALRFALETHPDAEITVLHVVGEPSPLMGKAVRLALEEDVDTAANDIATELFEDAHRIAADHDATIDTEVKLGQPSRAIVKTAEAFDLVVMGSHGSSLSDRFLTGNVAETVFRRSPVPVTAVR